MPELKSHILDESPADQAVICLREFSVIYCLPSSAAPAIEAAQLQTQKRLNLNAEAP